MAVCMCLGEEKELPSGESTVSPQCQNGMTWDITGKKMAMAR